MQKERNKLRTLLEKSLTLLEVAHLTDDEHYVGNGVEAFIEDTRNYLCEDRVKHFVIIMKNGEKHYVDGVQIWSDEESYYVGKFGDKSEKFCKEEVSCISQFDINE